MANETYLKPHDVAFGGVTVKKVDRVQAIEVAQGQALYGDNALWPTSNRRHLRNARVTLTIRDSASFDALYMGLAGNLSFKVLVEKTGAEISKTWSNLIVVDRQGSFGGNVETGTVVLEVEAEDGLTGPWS